MRRFHQLCLATLAIAVVSLAVASSARAANPRPDVVRPADIQASIDQKVDGEAADREAVRALLRRPDVRPRVGRCWSRSRLFVFRNGARASGLHRKSVSI